MKITDVKAYPLQTPLMQPLAFSQGWVHKRSAGRFTACRHIVALAESPDLGIEVNPEVIAKYQC